jgi:UDP-glucose 4-epimerase
MAVILVIGGAGYIGSHIAFFLHKCGYTVIIIDLFMHDQTFNPSWAIVIRADYGDKKMLDTLFSENQIDAVIHCASFIEVGKSVYEPLSFYENNVSKTVILLQSMLKYNIKKIIFSSSCAVYGYPQRTPLTEDHPKKPLSPYGTTKAVIEQLLADVAQAHNIQYICLRYFNAAGAMPEEGLGEQHKDESHLIPLLLRSALYKNPFHVFGNNYPTPDGTAIRDFLHVKDIAQAHLKALAYLDQSGASVCCNLGTGTGYSVKQIIAIVERVCGAEIAVTWSEKRKGDAPILVAQARLAEELFGWRPQHSTIEEIISSAYIFMKP